MEVHFPLYIHRENTSVHSNGVCGLGGTGGGRSFSATLKRGEQRQEAESAGQPQLGYGGAVDEGVSQEVLKFSSSRQTSYQGRFYVRLKFTGKS